MKGIILAGGKGTRLYPITKVLSKQILPVYDKPMIYYSLSILMLAGIKEILIISSERDIPTYKSLLGKGLKYGVTIQYAIQKEPRGIAEAFIVGRSFIGDSSVALILGDNIFYGEAFYKELQNTKDLEEQAVVYAYYVKDPSNYGVVEFDRQGNAISIEEKPSCPKSNYVIPGLYFYDNSVVHKALGLKPSKRGEVEITDINKLYLYNNQLRVVPMDSKTRWFDTGNCKNLHEASSFVRKVQRKGNVYIGCIEEIAYKKGYISEEQLLKLAKSNIKSDYGRYLVDISHQKGD